MAVARGRALVDEVEVRVGLERVPQLRGDARGFLEASLWPSHPVGGREAARGVLLDHGLLLSSSITTTISITITIAINTTITEWGLEHLVEEVGHAPLLEEGGRAVDLLERAQHRPHRRHEALPLPHVAAARPAGAGARPRARGARPRARGDAGGRRPLQGERLRPGGGGAEPHRAEAPQGALHHAEVPCIPAALAVSPAQSHDRVPPLQRGVRAL